MKVISCLTKEKESINLINRFEIKYLEMWKILQNRLSKVKIERIINWNFIFAYLENNS